MNKNWKKDILPYMPESIVGAINKLPTTVICSATEIRLRAGGYSSVSVGRENKVLFNGDKAIMLSPTEMSEMFAKVCDGAIFKHENNIPKGFITIQGGHRVGFCGRAVYTDGKITNIADISSIVFRISRQIINCSSEIISEIVSHDYIYSTLIVGEPCSGKTTILSDISRLISLLGYRVAVVDERNEIGAKYHCIIQKDIGNLTDVLSEYTKGDGMMTALRCLSPQVMICDEIGGLDDVNAMLESVNAGVPIIATTHAMNEQQLFERPQIERLIDHGVIDKIIFLCGRNSPGKIRKVIGINKYDKDNWSSDFID